MIEQFKIIRFSRKKEWENAGEQTKHNWSILKNPTSKTQQASTTRQWTGDIAQWEARYGLMAG